ncbi:MAG: isochorismatase family protein [Rhodoferax sp.]|nr:isochorismatase family protein [Rhodoferax sp.]
MLLEASQSQLVLIDFQTRLMTAIRDAEAVVANAARLGKMARLLDVPCWGTEQNPDRLGATVPEVAPLCQRMLPKMHFSAVADGLVDWLQPPNKPAGGNARSLPRHLQRPLPVAEPRTAIVLAGCEAHVCLLQTALDLLEHELEVWVVVDACGSRSQRSVDAALDRLASAGAELVTTEMVAFEWLRSATHPQFKAVQALIK